MLVDETLRDAGVVEIGRRGGIRLAIGLEHRPAPACRSRPRPRPRLGRRRHRRGGQHRVGHRADLAQAAGGGTFHLLDLIPEPDPGDPDVAMFVDRPGRAQARAGRPHRGRGRPADARADRARAGRHRAPERRAGGDRRHHAAGGTAHWYSRRPARRHGDGPRRRRRSRATSRACRCAAPRRRAGDQSLLPDKSTAEFDLVFDVKVDGWFNLLHGLGDVPIGDRAGLQLDRRPVRQRRPDRLQRGQRPALQERVVVPLDAPGDTWRRHRLDGVGRHRHGQPRLDPEDDGAGRHRHASAGDRDPSRSAARSPPAAPAARSSSPARSVCMLDHAGIDRPICPPSTDAGPMVGQVAGARRTASSSSPSSTPPPSRSSTTTASRARRCCPG